MPCLLLLLVVLLLLLLVAPAFTARFSPPYGRYFYIKVLLFCYEAGGVSTPTLTSS